MKEKSLPGGHVGETLQTWGPRAQKTEPFKYDCIKTRRSMGSKGQEISDLYTSLWVRYLFYGLFRKCMKSWRLVTCQHSLFSQQSWSTWEPYLAVEKNGSVLLFPLVPKLVWESLCCLCQRRHIMKSGFFFLFLHFPSYLITAEQLGSHRGLQNRNSHTGKGAK